MRIAIADHSQRSDGAVATRLAVALARRGRRVLLAKVDSDDEFECGVRVHEEGKVLDRGGTLIVRDTEAQNLRVLGGFRQWLGAAAQDSPQAERVTALFADHDWVVFDGVSPDPSILRPLSPYADQVVVSLGEEDDTYEDSLEVLRALADAKGGSPDLKFGGFVRSRPADADASPAILATEARIAREFPNAFFSTVIPVSGDESAVTEAAAATSAFTQWAVELEERAGTGSGENSASRPRWWQRWRRRA